MDATIEVQQQGNQCQVQISGELSIYSVVELKQELLGYLQQSQEMELNLMQVEELDTAGIQLLMLLKREARQEDKTLKLVSHSAATLEVLELLKLAGFFGDPLVLAS